MLKFLLVHFCLLLIVIEVGVKAKRSERSREVVKVTQGVVANGVAFGMVVEAVGVAVGVAVGGDISGHDWQGSVKIVPVFDLPLIAVVTEKAVVMVVAVLVLVTVAVSIRWGSVDNRVNRMDCMDEWSMVVGVNHGAIE